MKRIFGAMKILCDAAMVNSCYYVCVNSKSLQLCLTLCDPMDCGPPGSSVHGILQARILEWVAMASSRRSSQPRDGISLYLALAGRFFTISATSEAPDVIHLPKLIECITPI